MYNTSAPFTSPRWQLLDEFSREAWGHPERFLKTDSSPDVGDIEYVNLGMYLPAVELCFNTIKINRVIVRNEYRLALEALQEDQYTGGAYVTGQPGIGKTAFLVYLLVHFLGKQDAVAIQLPYSEPHYAFFTAHGAVIQSDRVSLPMENYPGNMWALCDYNEVTKVPCNIFSKFQPRMRVIQATLPKSPRWKGWSWYFMDIWSREEVKKLAILSHLRLERTIELAEKWGCIPRSILKYYSESDDVVEADIRGMLLNAVHECQMILQERQQCDLPDGDMSPFYFVRPKNEPNSRAKLPVVSVPTRTLRCLLAEGLQQQDKDIQLRFFKALSALPETRQSARFIYESFFHSFFTTQDKEIQCNWLPSTIESGETQDLQSTSTVISAIQEKPASWIPPFYWVPDVKNFPGIDSALISREEIITFQLIISDKHKSLPNKGFSKLRDLLPENLKNLRWRLVFVGTENGRAKSIAEKWESKIFFPTEHERVSVGWAVVDPVRDDILFTHYRDEDDRELEDPMQEQ